MTTALQLIEQSNDREQFVSLIAKEIVRASKTWNFRGLMENSCAGADLIDTSKAMPMYGATLSVDGFGSAEFWFGARLTESGASIDQEFISDICIGEHLIDQELIEACDQYTFDEKDINAAEIWKEACAEAYEFMDTSRFAKLIEKDARERVDVTRIGFDVVFSALGNSLAPASI